MTERARHLAERVFPTGVRVRQWVLSLPFDLRIRAAFDHRLALALVRETTRAIERRYRRLARDAGFKAPRGGSVTVLQRFSSDLRTNLHLHILALDGAYGTDKYGCTRLFRAPAPSPAEVEQVLSRIVRRWRRRQGRDVDECFPDDEELALAQTVAASAGSTGVNKHAPGDIDEDFGRVLLPTRRKARIDGFDLDAEVAVKKHERDRLEHLCRYVLRPPLALDRLKVLGPDLVAIALKRPWKDGTTHVSMNAKTFLTRLASLVPRPRANTTLYAGVLAAHSKHRRRIIPKAPNDRAPARDRSWAALMKHSFGLDVLSCRACKGRMRLVAVLFDKHEIRRLLCYLRCFSDPLPVHPARGPPEHEETCDFP